MTRTLGPTILDALSDKELFGALPAFRDLGTWRAWMTALGASYGLPLSPDEQELFCKHTGRSHYAPPPGGWKESIFIVGRQSGKTTAASVIVAYEAAFYALERRTGPLYALLIAQDHRAVVRTIFSYIDAAFQNSPILAQMVRQRKTESLSLDNGVILAAYPCRPSALRGLRARVLVADELGFFRSSEGSPQDTEMLRAVRPTLATTGGRLIILSSPAGQQGALWELFERHYARDESPVLVWQASAPEMNPALPADYLARMELDDPEGYRSEVLGEFRAGGSLLFDPEAIRACIVPGRHELSPNSEVPYYQAFVDASGGRRDAFACAIGHRVGDMVVLDALRSWRAPFNPSGVVTECGALLSAYGVSRVRGDRYATEWVAEAFRLQRIWYEESPLPASELYLELLPAVNAAQVGLLDLKDLRQELLCLERRQGPSGKDRIVHPPSRHDDLANAVAGLVHVLIPRSQRMFEGYRWPPEDSDPQVPTYKPCKNCGTDHLTTEATPRCPQEGWTWDDIRPAGCR